MLEGDVVGAYRMRRQIGAGGMGEVWLAEHTLLGRTAAVKILHPSYAAQPDVVTRFFNEARAATAIADSGIVQIFDFGNDDGIAYLVMEFLEGETLDARRRRGIGLVDSLRIMKQVASSLGAAHSRGIIHRDLKPENIFLVPDAEVIGGVRAKILDFGIAKLLGDDSSVKTSTSAVMGTPMFMSPEQCKGAGQVDARSDVYSLGCVLFMLIANRTVFVADGIGELIVKHITEPAPLVSTLAWVPPAVDELIAACLEKDPARRPASAGQLALALGMLATDPAISRVGVPAARPGAVSRMETSAASWVGSQPNAGAATPTTLSGSATGGIAVPRPRRALRIGLVAGVVTLVGAIAVGAMSQGSGGGAGSHGSSGERASGAGTTVPPVPQPQPPVPPAPPAPPIDAAALSVTPPPPQPAAVDAGVVVDAPPPDASLPDASPKSHTPAGTPHTKPHGPMPDAAVDRAD